MTEISIIDLFLHDTDLRHERGKNFPIYIQHNIMIWELLSLWNDPESWFD